MLKNMFKRLEILLFMAMFITVFISFIILLGVGIGLGWVLTLIFPFTLFEGSVLAVIATALVGNFWLNTFNQFKTDDVYDEYERNMALLDDEDEKDYPEYDEIPTERFYKTADEQTGEAMFRHQIANGIYIAFQDEPHTVGPMGPSQTKELAVRLADLAMALCKRKPPHTKTFRITKSALKKEMTKMGLRPYDDDILNVTVKATNAELLDEIMDDIIRQKLWDIFFMSTD